MLELISVHTSLRSLFFSYRSYVIIKTPSTYDFKWNMFRSFSPRLWVAIGITMALLAISLASIDLLHRRHGLRDDGDYSLTRATLIVFGAFCQEGTLSPRWIFTTEP
jgi:hypothetical protein